LTPSIRVGDEDKAADAAAGSSKSNEAKGVLQFHREAKPYVDG